MSASLKDLADEPRTIGLGRRYDDPCPEPENHRFNRVDLDELAPWLIQRFQQRHPLATPRVIVEHLITLSLSSEHIFLRSARAVICARAARETFTPPWCEEVFCLCVSPEDEDEAGGLYDPVRRWARMSDIAEMHVGIWTDVTKPTLRAMLGKLVSRERFVARTVRQGL